MFNERFIKHNFNNLNEFISNRVHKKKRLHKAKVNPHGRPTYFSVSSPCSGHQGLLGNRLVGELWAVILGPVTLQEEAQNRQVTVVSGVHHGAASTLVGVHNLLSTMYCYSNLINEPILFIHNFSSLINTLDIWIYCAWQLRKQLYDVCSGDNCTNDKC